MANAQSVIKYEDIPHIEAHVVKILAHDYKGLVPSYFSTKKAFNFWSPNLQDPLERLVFNAIIKVNDGRGHGDLEDFSTGAFTSYEGFIPGFVRCQVSIVDLKILQEIIAEKKTQKELSTRQKSYL